MREMKDSGVEWVGEIPADWALIRLKDKYQNVKAIAGKDSTKYERLALTMSGVIKRPKDDSEGLQPKEFDGYQILEKDDFIFIAIQTILRISGSRLYGTIPDSLPA